MLSAINLEFPSWFVGCKVAEETHFSHISGYRKPERDRQILIPFFLGTWFATFSDFQSAIQKLLKIPKKKKNFSDEEQAKILPSIGERIHIFLTSGVDRFPFQCAKFCCGACNNLLVEKELAVLYDFYFADFLLFCIDLRGVTVE